jgi:hypothetical protein
MARFRAVLGLIGSAMLILSAAAHSLGGGPAIAAELRQAGVPPALLTNMTIAWHFGGVAMLVLGVIVAAVFVRRLRGLRTSPSPALLTGGAYVLFGGWAILASRNPFFLIFVVPGALMLAAAGGGADPGT